MVKKKGLIQSVSSWKRMSLNTWESWVALLCWWFFSIFFWTVVTCIFFLERLRKGSIWSDTEFLDIEKGGLNSSWPFIASQLRKIVDSDWVCLDFVQWRLSCCFFCCLTGPEKKERKNYVLGTTSRKISVNYCIHCPERK